MMYLPKFLERLKRLKRDEDGAMAVEAVLILPTLIFLVAGVFETIMVLFLNVTLEHAVLSASRFGVTGQGYSDSGGSLTGKQNLGRGVNADIWSCQYGPD